jgi:transcription antitermination factor NusG
LRREAGDGVDGLVFADGVRDVPPQWYALYTRARHEKKVDRLLRLRQFEVFLPLVPRQRQWHDRKKIVDWPLFPGYVFARFGLDATAQVLGTPGVATVVRQDGAPAPIPELEIANVRRLASVVSETGSLPEPTPMVRRGERARIMRGPFSGVHGVVLQHRGGGKVLLQIGLEVIGQGVKIEIEEANLREIRSAV